MVGALNKVSTAQNGVGAFILQCKRLDFHYCDWAGSSRGMKSFIRNFLPAFARANPSIEVTISPRPNRHPVVRGHFVNGRERGVCVRNLEPSQILQKAENLRDASGEKVKKQKKAVSSINQSVRGIWSPFHERPEQAWRI